MCYYYYTLCREPGNSDAQHMQRQESEAHKYIHARRERERQSETEKTDEKAEEQKITSKLYEKNEIL